MYQLKIFFVGDGEGGGGDEASILFMQFDFTVYDTYFQEAWNWSFFQNYY